MGMYQRCQHGQKGSEETAPLIVFGKLSQSGKCLWENRSLFLVNVQRKIFSSLTCCPVLQYVVYLFTLQLCYNSSHTDQGSVYHHLHSIIGS